MYRQSDGYPTGHGAELAEFLTGIKIVNGLSVRACATCGDYHPDIPADFGHSFVEEKVANGGGDLAAQVVAHFKEMFPVGGIYLMAKKTRDVGEEFVYIVDTSSNSTEIKLSCFSFGAQKAAFVGKPEEFDGESIERLINADES
jgi:hypothetical protein